MNTKSKKVKFDSSDIIFQLDSLGIKPSHLGKRDSIYYIGFSAYTINKAFRTGTIAPDILDKIEKLISYLANPKNKRPTVVNFVELQNQNNILQKQLDSLKNRDNDRVKELKEIIQQVANDLSSYSKQFHRASDFLQYSLDE